MGWQGFGVLGACLSLGHWHRLASPSGRSGELLKRGVNVMRVCCGRLLERFALVGLALALLVWPQCDTQASHVHGPRSQCTEAVRA